MRRLIPVWILFNCLAAVFLLNDNVYAQSPVPSFYYNFEDIKDGVILDQSGNDLHGQNDEGYFIQVGSPSSWIPTVDPAAESTIIAGQSQMRLVALSEVATSIQNIRPSNLSSASVTISWITDHPSYASVNYGQTTGLGSTAKDGLMDDTHLVQITGLESETTYYFQVVSGSVTDDNEGNYYSFQTAKVGTRTPFTVFGRALKSDGLTAAEGSIAYVSVGESALLSDRVDANGNWNVNLGNLKSASGDVFGMANEAVITVTIEGAADGVGLVKMKVGPSSPQQILPINIGVLVEAYAIDLKPGWNMISIPGIPADTDPQSLVGDSETALLPMFRWNPAGFSYQEVTELKFGEGYWILSLNPAGEKLELPVTLLSSYTTSLKPGWNMIGGVSQVTDFTSPQDNPDNSIIPGTLYSWNPTSFSYQPETEILPNQGYWVLTLRDCQLTVRSEIGIQTAPQAVPALEVMIQLNLSAGDWHQNLQIGLDQSAAAGLEPMDRALPPIGPQAQDYQAHLISGQYRLRRDVRPMSDQTVSWQMRLSSPEPVQLTVDSQEIPDGQELVISDGQMETVLSAGMEMQLASGERELTVSLRPLPEVTQLLQNYPNPFNPETWIPFELNQDSDVSLTIYDTAGRQIRHLDLGFQPAGAYLRRDRAIYWDGRTQSGEQVASGTYFYTLKTADYVSTQKMIILK